jgi:hypothetical protein
MAKYEETADKKISRKVAREWRTDIMKRSHRGLPDPHREKYDQDRGQSRIWEAEKKGKFRGREEAPSANVYYLGTEYAGGGRALRGLGKAFMKGGKVK